MNPQENPLIFKMEDWIGDERGTEMSDGKGGIYRVNMVKNTGFFLRGGSYLHTNISSNVKLEGDEPVCCRINWLWKVCQKNPNQNLSSERAERVTVSEFVLILVTTTIISYTNSIRGSQSTVILSISASLLPEHSVGFELVRWIRPEYGQTVPWSWMGHNCPTYLVRLINPDSFCTQS